MPGRCVGSKGDFRVSWSGRADRPTWRLQEGVTGTTRFSPGSPGDLRDPRRVLQRFKRTLLAPTPTLGHHPAAASGRKSLGCLQPQTLHPRVPGSPCTPPGSLISVARALVREGRPRTWTSCAPCPAALLKGVINEHLPPQSSGVSRPLQASVKGAP